MDLVLIPVQYLISPLAHTVHHAQQIAHNVPVPPHALPAQSAPFSIQDPAFSPALLDTSTQLVFVLLVPQTALLAAPQLFAMYVLLDLNFQIIVALLLAHQAHIQSVDNVNLALQDVLLALIVLLAKAAPVPRNFGTLRVWIHAQLVTLLTLLYVLPAPQTAQLVLQPPIAPIVQMDSTYLQDTAFQHVLQASLFKMEAAFHALQIANHALIKKPA